MTNNKYQKIAREIVETVGEGNIESVSHCATRLRLSVHDRKKINDEEIQQIDEVKGVFYTGGQYQIILGTGIVNNVYEEINSEHEFTERTKDEMKENNEKGFQRAIRILADVFIPIIPILGATGLFLGLQGVIFNESVLGFFGLSPDMIPDEFNTIINILTSTAFAFLPAFITWSAFKTFGGTPVVGFLIGLMLVSPELPNAYAVAEGDANPIMVLGYIPIIGYQGSILTALFAGIIGAKIEKFLRKRMPNALDLIFTPFFVIIIMLLISLFIMGPVVKAIETVGIDLVTMFIGLPVGLGGFLIGFLYPLAVMTGLHHMFIIAETSMLAATGFNPLITLAAMYGFSNAGVTLALSLRSRQTAFKTAGISATITQLLGVSEPALFGVVLRSGMRALFVMLACSSLGGGILALLGIQANSYGLAVILSPLMYLYDFSQLLTYVIVGIATFALAFVATHFIAVPKGEVATENASRQKVAEEMKNTGETASGLQFAATTDGELLSLGSVNDPVFSQRMMGEGYAVEPENDEIYSPVSGTVTMITDTNHAIGLETEEGVEILVHMGIDTVNLKENIFSIHVTEGQKISINDKLADMDRGIAESLGYESTIITVITNTPDKVDTFKLKNLGQVKHGEMVAESVLN
ncbi:glucose PTS transporter subunit IIA [Salinicoccus hispanicus]|uniref:PTS transporter subunit EIIC n=1 Tax=Salinicoccus hispanicus TaxID=157225 RepID=A0A6N8U0J3_9STAP|nr:PTS transporter subunit IIBCA [Salinicoccus hispanicus]MXQ51282.1 PTS transporter subunit EIIC [Salinicoccus hispanicus]